MSLHEDVIQKMQAMSKKYSERGIALELPPQSSQLLGTRFIDTDYAKMLTVEIKFDLKFTNPLHAFQGGFLCGVFDEAYGPLTYMATGRPVVTIEMSTTFIRPFTQKDELIIVRADIIVQSKTLIVLKGEAKNKEGKLIAISTSHSLILPDPI